MLGRFRESLRVRGPFEMHHRLALARLTYTLLQGEGMIRRATIWRRVVREWKTVYQPGTIVEGH